MKTFAQHSKELEEAPLIQDQIPAVKSMATKIVNLLTKENSKRRIQLMWSRIHWDLSGRKGNWK